MAILGVRGVRGGVGTTSVTVALAWALQSLGESVLVIDASPDNMLRFFFNVNVSHSDGWARAILDGRDWHDVGMRYTANIDILPFGRTAQHTRETPDKEQRLLLFADSVRQLHRQGDHRWLLLDLPQDDAMLTHALINACDHNLLVVNTDANSHIRLHQQAFPPNTDILINDLHIDSQLQKDVHQLWLESSLRVLPMAIHRDEAMAECLAAKQPLGEYCQNSLAAQEVLTLANWCLLHYSGKGQA